MSQSPDPTPPSAGAPRPEAPADATPVTPGFEETLRQFWERYRGVILALCVLGLLIIVGRSGWELLQERRAANRADAYAAASSPEQLKAFAAEHAGSELGGVAQLQVADQAYAERRFGEAKAAYQAAQEALADTALADRARLGAAVASLKAGETEAAKAAMQEIANDVAVAQTVRAEAAFHLASLAAEAGAKEEVARLTDQINAIAPSSIWSQRGTMLRAQSGVAPATPPAEQPAVSFPTPGS